MRTRSYFVLTVAFVCLTSSALGQDAKKSPEPGLGCKPLKAKLEAKPQGQEADRLATAIRQWFGKANLTRGASPKIEGWDVAWAIELPEPARQGVKVIAENDPFVLALTRVGDSNIYAGVATLSDGDAFVWRYEADGKAQARGGQRNSNQLEVYRDHPDALPQPGVPKGKVIEPPPFAGKIFDGATREWWVYVPAQYRAEQPACVMVFQDGAGYKDYVATVFDNLIAKGDMPVTIGVFLNPGKFANGRPNRGFEYDTLSNAYARFLLEEVLPEVEKTWKLRHDPESRAIAGISSGGICAWTVAWERPDEFRKVLSWVGSFTNIASGKTGREGGHNYQAMIRKTPKKPIRVFLQDGANDLDNANGNWPLANQEMAKSLEFAKYDYQFVYGKGFHSPKHGRAIMPDSLRWLWRDWRDTIK